MSESGSRARLARKAAPVSHFDQFNRQVRAALVNAQYEAIFRDHAVIAPAHLLFGILKERKGIGSKVLRNLALPEPALVLALDFGPDEWKLGRRGEPEFSATSLRVLVLAVDERRSRDHHEVGTTHLLLSICREEEESGTGIFQSLGMEPAVVRTELLRFIDSPEESSFRSTFGDWLCRRN